MPKNITLVLAGLMAISVSFWSFAQNQAVIMQYHHVSTDTPPVTSISPERFIQHMDYLAANNFTVMALEEVITALQEGNTLPDKTVVITFDDGYTSVFEEAYPLLKAYDWPYTIFVTSGLVGSNDRLYATWDQLREMAEHGATLANHTVTHPYLLQRNPGESDDEWLEAVRKEILDAESRILEETGQNHRLLAYPYGEYNLALQALVRELGFIGIAQHSGPINSSSDFTALPRFPLSGIYSSMNTYPEKMMSLAFALDQVTPLSPVTDEKSPTATLDFADDQQGLSQINCFNNNEIITAKLQNSEAKVYEISTHLLNESRRFRYNCTAAGGQGRYYWYSIPWVNPVIPE